MNSPWCEDVVSSTAPGNLARRVYFGAAREAICLFASMGGTRAIEPVSKSEQSDRTAMHHRAYYVLSVVTVLNVVNLWHRYLLVSVCSAFVYLSSNHEHQCACQQWARI